MAESSERTEELSKSSLDVGKPKPAAVEVAILRCVEPSVLRGTKGREIKLGSSEITIGRGSNSSVVVDGVGMSRLHARVYYSEGAWRVEDLGSTNGTRVNNSNVKESELQDGDTVAFGRVCYKFVKLNTVGTGRRLDLGLERTVTLDGPGRPGAAVTQVMPAPVPPRGARHPEPSPSAGRHKSPEPERNSGSQLGVWSAAVLAALAATVATVLILT